MPGRLNNFCTVDIPCFLLFCFLLLKYLLLVTWLSWDYCLLPRFRLPLSMKLKKRWNAISLCSVMQFEGGTFHRQCMRLLYSFKMFYLSISYMHKLMIIKEQCPMHTCQSFKLKTTRNRSTQFVPPARVSNFSRNVAWFLKIHEERRFLQVGPNSLVEMNTHNTSFEKTLIKVIIEVLGSSWPNWRDFINWLWKYWSHPHRD